MPDAYISQIDFGDGVLRTIKAEGGGGTGLYIGDVSDFDAEYTTNVQKVTLTWTDPNDIVISGVTQAEWAGTVIVRKEGSVPVSSGDGTVVVNSTVRNQYATNGFEDTSIEFDTEYYYRAFPYTTAGQSTAGSSVFAEAEQVILYGVEWDGTATTSWTRTDLAADFTNPNPYAPNMSGTPSSPFDNIMPWAGMTIEERTGGTMVKIPKFWYKLTQNGAGLKIQITTRAREGFHVSPAHMDRGDGQGERDVVYVGRYACDSSTYKSITNAYPYRTIKKSTARTNIHSLGSTIWQFDFATLFTIWLLYLVEYANWNSQAKIGNGCTSASGVYSHKSGYTNSMPYHTGTVAPKGVASSDFGIQYRNIEGLWGNVFNFIDGYRNDGGGLYITLNPSQFRDQQYGVLVGTPTGGLPSAFTVIDIDGAFPMFIPTASNGSTSTYSCDNWYYDSYNYSPCYYVGAPTNGGLNYGLFFFDALGLNETSSNVGCRLIELPDNT